MRRGRIRNEGQRVQSREEESVYTPTIYQLSHLENLLENIRKTKVEPKTAGCKKLLLTVYLTTLTYILRFT